MFKPFLKTKTTGFVFKGFGFINFSNFATGQIPPDAPLNPANCVWAFCKSSGSILSIARRSVVSPGEVHETGRTGIFDYLLDTFDVQGVQRLVHDECCKIGRKDLVRISDDRGNLDLIALGDFQSLKTVGGALWETVIRDA